MTTYIRDGSWRPVTEIYIRDGSWRTVNSVWVYTGSGANEGWKQVHSTGTFSPTLRNPTTEALFNNRSVGLPVELYRGSTQTGSYAYKFQYSYLDQVSWTNEDVTPNNNGTLTGATLTTSFTTDISYLNALENAAYSGNVGGELDNVDTYRRQDGKFIFIRARVIKSGETQFTNTVRIQKRRPIDTGTYLQLTRSTGAVFNLSTTNRSPRPGDTLRWITSFQNTTTFTNDTRPDYYWVSFDGGSGTAIKNSVLSDPANPRNPINAGSYLVQNSDIGAQIVSYLRAINSNTDTTDLFFATLEVSDGALQAPTNLILSYSGGALRGSWDAALGGNDNPITYVYSLERDGVVIFTSTSQSTTTFTRSTATSGNYRFRVTASQSGSVSVTSNYSNIFTVSAPAEFNVTVQNVTGLDLYRPSTFSINAPTLSSTVLNRWDWTWGTSTILGPAYAKTGSFNTTTINSWTSQITRPTGTTNSFTVSSPTDYWTITESGNHTETVTARNTRKNYVRVSWTKPAGTTAASYSVYISGYFPGAATAPDWNLTINVEDVTFVDIEQDYFANGTNYGNSSAIRVNSVRAFSGPGQTGIETFGFIPAFNFNGADGTTDWSNCNVVGTRQASRTDNLTLENPQTGFIYITGTFEPGFAVTMTGTRPGTGVSGWSPSFDDTGWTHTYKWYRSGTVNFAQISGANAKSFAIPLSSAFIGDNIDASVTSVYKGQSFGERFDSTSDADSRVVPNPPTFSLSDNGNRTASVSLVNSIGATFYYGTYGGVGNGFSIPETAIATTSTSSQFSAGSLSATLNARRYVNLVYPTTQTVQVNSLRSTTNTITLAPSPQDTGSRRFLLSAPSVGAGNTLFISTNGFFGNATMPTNNYLTSTLPSPGAFLNIAAQDLVMVYCFTKVDSGGTWIRYRGYRYNTPSGPFLEYQAYLTFSGSVYVLFIENGITDYRASLAYFINGTQQSTWLDSSSDTSGFTINQGTTGWTSRSVTTGSNDDGIISFTVIAPARQHQAGAVTRTAGGFTFNVTNVEDNTFESAATYTVTINLPSPAAVSINASTGLVTVTGLTSSQFATVTVSKTRTGYENATNVVVQGQALAGSPPSQVTAPSFSTSGTVDGSGTVRRAQVNAVLTRAAGTYNNEQSKTTALLTILSNSYTGADSNWTSAGDIGTSVTISNSAASSSANMYRVRDRVVGTDGSTVDFYSSVIYRAVYAPPPGGFSTIGTNSVVIQYTGGGGPQRYYRYQDGFELGFITDSGAGPFTTTFSGLTPDTQYNLQLFGANNEGYLSIGFVGGSVRTSQAVTQLATPGNVQASDTNTNGVTITWNTVTGAAYYGVWYGPTPGYDALADFGGNRNPNLIVHPTNSYFDTSIGPGVTRDYYVQAYRSGDPTGTKSNWGGPNSGTRASAPPPTAPAITSGPSISWSSGNNFTLSATASNATNLEFFVEFANNNGGPALRTQTFFFGASSGGGQTGAQANSWARTQVRANNTTTGLSSPFSGFTNWA